MATKKLNEYNDMSVTDLKAELEQVRAQYHKLNFDHTIKGLDNPVTLKTTRRDIARLMTALRQRELADMTPAQVANRSKIRARRKKA